MRRSISRLYGLNYVGVHFKFELKANSSPLEGFTLLYNCSHDSIDPEMQQSLDTGQVGKVAVNVLAMAMIFSTPDLNAVLLLAESGRFTLSEPIVFHEVNYLNSGIRQRLEKCRALKLTSNSNAKVLKILKLASNQKLESSAFISSIRCALPSQLTVFEATTTHCSHVLCSTPMLLTFQQRFALKAWGVVQ